MAKEFTPVEIDLNGCRLDLVEFKALLDKFRYGTLKEREHVLNWPKSLHDGLFHRRYDIAEARESLLGCEAALNKLTRAW